MKTPISPLLTPSAALGTGTGTGRAPAGGREGTEPAAPAVEPIRILIVDDEPANLVVLETLLDDPGYRLVRAQSANQALLALVEQEFALLILDVHMPDMSGIELAQMVKERKKTAHVPIIFLTAYYDKDQHVLEGYGTGAVDYLSKPVNPAVLRSKVAVFADLDRKNRAIQLSNRALTIEVEERRRAEEQLRELNENLERRVTERTEALRQADRKLQAIMGSITDGLLMLDRDWCFTYANEQGAQLLGMQPGRLIGACMWTQFPQAVNSPFEAGFRQAVQTRQTVSFEAFYPAPLDMWFHCHCYPSDDGLSVYFHDITDRREVDSRREQLLAAEQAARNEGERVARAKDEFLASLSHELRTPLAAIVGWANVLMRPALDADTLRRGIEAIARNAQAQSHLIADLLDMSRIVSGKLRMEVARVDLNQVAAAAADTARPAAQGKALNIVLQLDRGQPMDVLGDAARLAQIVTNLVTNALKFTPPGGSVTLATRATQSHVELSVTDTGQGISAEFLPRLFDRFSQADGSAARVHGGLGLGLSIVQNLVELHAGKVSASSAGAGQGATFTLQFPRAADGPLQLAPGDGQGPEANDLQMGAELIDLQGVSVLLVDDHADVLEVERRLLSEHGAEVTTALTAEQALGLLVGGQRFDVLLSDLGMPGMDGYALIHHIRTQLGMDAEQLPACAVTAFVRAEDRRHALDEGYQCCIQKPVSPAALVRTVQALLPPRPAPSPAPAAALPGPAGATGPRRLRTLFVEDNDDLREQIGWLLEDEGLDLVSCVTGEEAIEAFEQGLFDLVLTDVSLPKMSGVDLARWVLAREPAMWVIFSTGYSMGDRLGDFGPNVRSLLKPFEIEQLHELVREVRSGLMAAG
ncbi:MAG TPA: response regulator [Ideonella sp.]|uniref:response regulator n=1 Tax=Ideonella sp. TaxID=1929293 RepID=UPI002D12A5B4|nr:response regulator [Ideonella sp.]HSI47905.1 response regulator [Ideonella sp.]